MKFPRSGGPLVSFLIPTRGRPERVRGTIDRILEAAHNPDSCEFVLKLDGDDDCLTAYTDLVRQWTRQGVPIKVYISPRGWGWRNIYLWLDQMALLASGDWLSIWNDDATMVTPHWDLILANAEVPGDMPRVADVYFLRFRNRHSVTSYSYGAWRRRGFEVLGHFSGAILADHWLYEVTSGAGVYLDHPVIEIDHVSGRERDDVWKEGGGGYTETGYQELKTPRVRMGIMADTIKLAGFVAGSR